MVDPETLETLPPNDDTAEKSIVGSVLLDPCKADAILCEIINRLKIGPEVFYSPQIRIVYETILELFDDGVAIDTVTVSDRLKIWDKLDQIGGTQFLSQLADGVTSSQNLADWIKIVLQKYMLRRVISFCADTQHKAYSVNGNAPQFLSDFEHSASTIRDCLDATSTFINIPKTTRDLLADYENASHANTPTGIQTGFPDLDRLNTGLMEQELIIVAGLRSTGKTTLALNIALHVAGQGIGAGIISLETSGKKLIHRLLCCSGELAGGELMRGDNMEKNATKVVAAAGRISALMNHLFISERGDMSLTELSALCRRMYQRGCRLFIIDYLQLLQCPGKSEYDKITAGSKFAKRLAKTLNSPVILLSALNRESEKGNKPRPPRLSDLRASGQIEYDADKAWLLYDPEFREDFSNDPTRRVTLNFAKNKDGPTGLVDLIFFPQQFRIGSISRVSDDPVPTNQTPLPYTD